MLGLSLSDEWLELLEDLYCDHLEIRRKRTTQLSLNQGAQSGKDTSDRQQPSRATPKELGIATKISKYSGTNDICASWFVDFEGLMELLRVDQVMWRIYLNGCFVGKAGKAFTTFKQNRSDGWGYDEFKEYMIDMFDTKMMKDLSKDLDWIRQQPRELASDFRLRWEELMAKITQKGTVMTEDFQISILRNRMLKRYDMDVKDFKTKADLFKHCIAKDPKNI